MLRLANSSQFVSKLFHNTKMPAFTLYGGPGSSNTDRVRLTLAEGGFTDYEMVFLDMFKKGEQKSEEHIKRNPWGKVPVMVTQDGFTIYESRPICSYLAKKYSFPLFPSSSDLEATALFEQAQSEEMFYFADPATKLGFEKFIKPKLGLPLDEAAVSNALRSLETFSNIVEKRLEQHKYMAGDDFSLVDIYYIPLVQRLFVCGHGDIITSRKSLAAWWERCTSRPAIHKMMAADKEAAAAAGRR